MTSHPETPGTDRAPDEPQPSLAELRDQLLGPPRPDEDLESYRLRAYQARRQAVELLGNDMTPGPDEDETEETDRLIRDRRAALAATSETLAAADRSWTEDATPPRPERSSPATRLSWPRRGRTPSWPPTWPPSRSWSG
jgi:hypothetical protein